MVSLQPQLRLALFPVIGSLRLRDFCRRLGGGVGCAGAAEKATGESLRLPRASGDAVTLTNGFRLFPPRMCLCSPPWLAPAGMGLACGRYFGVGDVKIGKGHQRDVEVEVVIGSLTFRCSSVLEHPCLEF